MASPWRRLKAACSSTLQSAGRAALPLAGPYKPYATKKEDAGALAPGVYEWRADFAGDAPALVELFAEGAAPVRSAVRAGRASGLIEIPRAASLRVLPHSAKLHLRRLNHLALAARTLAQAQNRRAIFARWARHGSTAAMRALIAASSGAAVEDYQAWIAAYEMPQQDAAVIKTWLATLPDQPLISIVTPVYETPPAWLRACVESVRAQAYPIWEHCLVDDCSPSIGAFQLMQEAANADPRFRVARRNINGGISAATNDAIAMCGGSWIAFLDHDDTLSTDALALAAAAIAEHPDARIIYTDEDKIDEAGVRSEPYMKGDWNPALFAAQNYLNHLTLIRSDLIAEAGGLRSQFDGSQDYDLLLRCVTRVNPEQIVHIPATTYHWRFGAGGANFSVQQAAKTQARMRKAYAANGIDGISLDAAADGLPYPRIRPPIPDPPPLVSLIIPTRDGAELLSRCIQTLKEKAGWPRTEFIVMDNDSDAPDALALFDSLRKDGIQVEHYPGPFNFSAINNSGAKLARGSIIGFVNNDIEARSADWLLEMVRWFSQSSVAAVGAKLLYPDGRVQHAGIVTGIGGTAGHLFKYREGTDAGPFGHLARARDVSALTAACLLVRREAFHAV
ncbi:MAG: glycosyltransferase, partial [Pseudomonadota bacterium]